MSASLPAPRRPLTNARLSDHTAQTWTIVTDQGDLAITCVTAAIIQLAFTPIAAPPHLTWSLVDDLATLPAPPVTVTQQSDLLTLHTTEMAIAITLGDLHITAQRADGSVILADAPPGGLALEESGQLGWQLALEPGERIFGGGQRTGGLNQRGRRITHWCADPLPNHSSATDMLYQSVPFLVGLREGRAQGIFVDTTWRTVFDIGVRDPNALQITTTGPDFVLYLCAGPDLAAVMAQYTSLTGRMPLPPRWSLGNQQSRWSYMSAPEVMEVARGFREQDIPCDAIYLDIDYMRGYRDFTWDADRFPDPAGLVRELGDLGFRVVPIIDPGVKVDPDYATYREGGERGYFARNPDGTPFAGWVWPGSSVWADFARAEVRDWWAEQHRSLLELGVAGIWDDMNEPSQAGMSAPLEVEVPFGATLPLDAQFGPLNAPISHAAFHNAYGLAMTQATRLAQERYRPDARPFVLTRAATAGTQRFAIVWNGDNTSMWEHVRLAISMNLGLGLSGFPVTGSDIGGFWQDCAPELLVRFTQVGAFLPFCRNHSSQGTRRQEPWAFCEPYTSACRAALQQRYRLLPLLVTLAHVAHATGAPIMRPLAWIAPTDPASVACDDQFLLGNDLLIAPVIEPAAQTRLVTLPPGDWFAWETGAIHHGPALLTQSVALATIPIFSRAGSIVPVQGDAPTVDTPPTEPLTLEIFLSQPGQRAELRLWDDDDHPQAQQRGTYLELLASAVWTGDTITVRLEHVGGTMPPRYPGVAVALNLPLGTAVTPGLLTEGNLTALPLTWRFHVQP